MKQSQDFPANDTCMLLSQMVTPLVYLSLLWEGSKMPFQCPGLLGSLSFCNIQLPIVHVHVGMFLQPFVRLLARCHSIPRSTGSAEKRHCDAGHARSFALRRPLPLCFDVSPAPRADLRRTKHMKIAFHELFHGTCSSRFE